MSEALDMDAFRKVADAANSPFSGGWTYGPSIEFDHYCIYPISDKPVFYLAKMSDILREDIVHALSKYIATFDPPTVLALLGRLEAAEARAVAAEGLKGKVVEMAEWIERTRDERNFPAHLLAWCDEAEQWLSALAAL